ncbi:MULTISPECIES: gamma-glutamyl-gamma-aminobutyrate hydrolase family protein [unclassified Halomonas]|uniref:gamma-glutamyl-gamma-aminobutyrate hydrolase family protein n=1 Tax=unclassified Halomonas TaxID=2609666 RepID=UPI00099067C4|nr:MULTISPECIES: gamma-glutamyl-gamma-aminobutyrate hydrolase family protein [unclassified Halomonas]AQU83851.1 gamma-glutamyl-gamma-aminobutyrate hydrolase [Halomonas sp. 'Soap Lake \
MQAIDFPRPLVGVIACCREVEGHPAQIVTDKYLQALYRYGITPVILPVLAADTLTPEQRAEQATTLLSSLDGLLLTGSYTNVSPDRYGAELAPENTRDDVRRDEEALGWVHEAVRQELPLFGICRGFQEMNVAFGGTLHQAVQTLPGMLDHREPSADDLAGHYAPSHKVDIRSRGVLATLYNGTCAEVNSLHQQGIDQLAPGLDAEAWAPDGLIEAISVRGAAAFALAVQWHPEWRPQEHPLYDALFQGFATACRQHRTQRDAQLAAC